MVMKRKLLDYKVPGCVVDGSVDIVVDFVVGGSVGVGCVGDVDG